MTLPGPLRGADDGAMYTISGVVMPDGTMRIWASEWPQTGRHPVVVFEADWRIPEGCRDRRSRLQLVARAAQEWLEQLDLFDAF